MADSTGKERRQASDFRAAIARLTAAGIDAVES